MNTIKELFDIAELDYKNLSIGLADNINFINFFDITPDAYLYFAKTDLKQKDDRGLINALSNAKRAIDCLIENTLKNFNINLKKVPKAALSFCEDVLDEDNKSISPFSLRLFCALGLSPNLLVSEVRSLRNKIEHEFNIPEKQDVIRAYEVAELLVNNRKAKEIYSCNIDISDITRQGNAEWYKFTGISFGPISSFRKQKFDGFQLDYWGKDNKEYLYIFDQEDKEFYYFIKAMFIAQFDNEVLIECIKKIISGIEENLSLDEINVNLRG
ncbi:hypothetical protein [Acinetobacter lactucae]|uniref:hypothetical protein n=1 Tax=Acinetobacter lactucae TaxID=1785128 RepID=UPI0012FE932D|nr:hypothetical protein [Acinetobacter lactucae]